MFPIQIPFPMSFVNGEFDGSRSPMDVDGLKQRYE